MSRGRKPCFKKSTYSSDSFNCIEVALLNESVMVRDSKNVEGPALAYDRASWQNFVSAVRGGAFNRATEA